MEQFGFKFDEWMDQAKTGLEEMKAKRADLTQRRDEMNQRLDKLNEEIEYLEHMLNVHVVEVTPEEPPPPKETRVTGIKKTAQDIAMELTIGVDWTINQLVKMIQEKVPKASTKSCRAAIQNLAKEGVFKRNPDMPGRCYSSTIGQKDDPPEGHETPEPETTPQPPKGPCVHCGEGIGSVEVAPHGAYATCGCSRWAYTDATGWVRLAGSEVPPEASKDEGASKDNGTEKTSQETAEGTQQESFELSPTRSPEDVRAAIVKDLGKKTEGIVIEDKNIAWIATDLKVEPKVVYTVIKKLLKEGPYETDFVKGHKIIRAKAAPGSKEELKHMTVHDKPLFDGSDRPDM